jgi:hypothetical protein
LEGGVYPLEGAHSELLVLGLERVLPLVLFSLRMQRDRKFQRKKKYFEKIKAEFKSTFIRGRVGSAAPFRLGDLERSVDFRRANIVTCSFLETSAYFHGRSPPADARIDQFRKVISSLR